MKWCDKCNTEYEEYAEVCADCGEPLISEIEYIKEKKSNNEVEEIEIQLVEVYETNLESDALMVQTFLTENGIVSELRSKGIGSYLQIYSGVNYLGTTICVSEEQAAEAKALIDEFWKANETGISEEPLTESVKNEATKMTKSSNNAAVSTSKKEKQHSKKENLHHKNDDDADMRAYRAKYNKKMNQRRTFLKVFMVFVFGTSFILMGISLLLQ